MMDKNNGEKRKVFLDDLPRDNRNFIDWKNSKKYKIKFIYDGIEGYFIIKDYISINQILVIEYDNKEYNIKTSNFKRGQLGVVLGKLSSEFKIEVGTRFQENKRDITIIGRKIIPKYNGDGTLRQSVKYYKYKCNLCGFDCGEHYRNGEYKDEMWIEESHLLTRKDSRYTMYRFT
jgi:hypothetical protein